MQFLITNNQGGYLWHTTEPLSRYQGWFLALGGKMIKIIDAIEGDDLTIDTPPLTNTLVIEGHAASPLTLIFDIRESYDTPAGERNYRINEESGIIWIYYNDEPLIIGMTYNGRYSFLGTWMLRAYPFDAARNSPPSSLWVYQALRFHSSRVVIAAGLTREEVMDQLFHAQHYSPRPYATTRDPYEAAKRSLLSLRVYTPAAGIKGLYAGLPWFFQFWVRDSAVSSLAFAWLNRHEARSLASMKLPSQSVPAYYDLAGNASALSSADGKLWLAFRAKELGIKQELRQYASSDFIYNKEKETWMDTISRAGARIELQALKLAILEGTPDETSFRRKVREHFFVGGTLLDGIHADGTPDTITRPNILLAAHLYPQLLLPEEWEHTIDGALKALWLSWGGFSTLDIHDLNFHPSHTGEISLSYHQGDSWFWINNLAAIAMQRINPLKYQPYIKRIFDASTNDILFYGIPGHASELSSASMFAPAGSPVQLWSAATYIELHQELHQ